MTYPAPTKVLSANYDVSGTQFAIADEDGDFLEPEDLWRLARAIEEHQHDDSRGLPIRRVETASAPAAAGQIQVSGDDFRWWADAIDAIRTAVSREGNQVLDGTWRYNLPLLLAAQVSTPTAPGASLSYLYAKPDGKLYIRSGSGPEAGVGAPPTWNLPAKAWETDQVPGTNPELLRLALLVPTWALAFDATATETAYARVRVPATYVAGLPLQLAVAWTAPAGVAGATATWRYGFARTGAGESLSPAWGPTSDLAGLYAGATGNLFQLANGSVTVPGLLPGDNLSIAMQRMGATGSVVGDAYLLDASVAFA